MRINWRALPRLAWPAAFGLGLAYLATSFLPRPEPSLRPPEELRARGQGYGEESPVRAILERNVLNLDGTPFAPLGSPLAPPRVPEAAAAALARPMPPDQPQAAFAPPEPQLLPKQAQERRKLPAMLSGGASVQGPVAAPGLPVQGIEGFRLVGVVAGGSAPVAMLQVDGAAVTLRPGEQARGWLLISVEPQQVLLRRGQETRRLPLAGSRP